MLDDVVDNATLAVKSTVKNGARIINPRNLARELFARRPSWAATERQVEEQIIKLAAAMGITIELEDSA